MIREVPVAMVRSFYVLNAYFMPGILFKYAHRDLQRGDASSSSCDKRGVMRDPLMPEKSSEQSQKQKRWVILSILALAIAAGALAAVTYEPRVRTYSVEVPVEIEYSDQEEPAKPSETSPPASE